MYRLWRKQTIKKMTPIFPNMYTEASFIQEISRIIKLLKKKEQLYLKITLDEQKKEAQANLKEFDKYAEQEKDLFQKLKDYKSEEYACSKTYMYTVFMRIQEIIEIGRQAATINGILKIGVQLQQAKKIVSELYGNMTYFQKFDIFQMLQFFQKNQNERIMSYFPKRKLSPLAPLNNEVKLLFTRVKSQQNDHSLRKTLSVQIKKQKKKEDKINDLVSQKLLKKELATQIRIEERKKKKKNLFKLYDILQIKPIAIQQSFAFRLDMEENMLERNQVINEERKRWQKRWQAQKSIRKMILMTE